SFRQAIENTARGGAGRLRVSAGFQVRTDTDGYECAGARRADVAGRGRAKCRVNAGRAGSVSFFGTDEDREPGRGASPDCAAWAGRARGAAASGRHGAAEGG